MRNSTKALLSRLFRNVPKSKRTDVVKYRKHKGSKEYYDFLSKTWKKSL